LQAIAALAITACSTSHHLDKAVELFYGLRRSNIPISLGLYNAVLDACARATILWNYSTTLADVHINAAASLSGSGICPFSRSSFDSPDKMKPFSRANWSEAIRLIAAAISEGAVLCDSIVPVEKQSKDAATLVLDPNCMGIGLKLP
jgi:hypothetical protein